MTAPDRRLAAVSCLVVGMCLAVGGCTRNSVRTADGTAQAELERALAVERATAAQAAGRASGDGASGGESRPSEVAENLARGHREAESGRLDQAARFYERVLREDPRHPVAHHRLGVIADQNRDFAAAERHYEAALEASPGDPDLLNDLGYCFFLQGRYPESERSLRDAIDSAPTHERALTNLGLLYGTIGDGDRALAVLRLTGSDEEAHAKLALLAPSSPAADLQAPLAPPLAPPVDPTTAGAVLQAGAINPAGSPEPAGAAASTTPAMQDLMGQLARAKQGTNATQAGSRPEPGRLPGLIDPRDRQLTDADVAAGLQPYTRAGRLSHSAARPAPAVDAQPAEVDAAARFESTPAGVVTANSEALTSRPPGDLPTWSPPPGTTPPDSRSNLTPDRRPMPSDGAGGAPPAAYPAATRRMPPAMFDAPRRYRLPADRRGQAADAVIGHSAVTAPPDAGMASYADDLARRDAEVDRLHYDRERPVKDFGSDVGAEPVGRTGRYDW